MAEADLLRIHEWNYVSGIKDFCQKLEAQSIPIGHLDMDTAVSSRTFDAALAAAGAVCRAVDAIMDGRVSFLSSSFSRCRLCDDSYEPMKWHPFVGILR